MNPFAEKISHTAETAELWTEFAQGRNQRVPIVFATDDQVWLKVAGKTFREFYTSPDVHLMAQLHGKKWACDHIACDLDPTYPEIWHVGTQYWMEENEFFGCQTILQDDDYAWAQPLNLELQDLIRHVRDIEPEETVRKSHAFRLHQEMRDRSEGLLFEDRPVSVGFRFETHGIFTKAAEVRGLDRLCEDLTDAPDLVDAYLDAFVTKTLERMRAWYRLATGEEPTLPQSGGYGCCDDSLQMISAQAYERFVLPHHERLYSAMTTGPRSIHLCGRAMQHYRGLHRKLGVNHIDGPGPFVDHGLYLAEFGPDFSFSAQMDHAVLAYGTPSEVEAMVRGVLTDGAKQPGKFQLMGLLCRDTPMENVMAAYRAGREHGRIGL